MTTLFDAMARTAAGLLLVPSLSDAIAVATVPFTLRRRRALHALGTSRFLVLVPAHNEELLIRDCIRSLAVQQYPRDLFRVVVIADNCDDRTASIARAEHVECLERTDPHNPGKPRAIAWALETAHLREFDAVVIVDADTVVDAEFLSALDCAGPLRDKAVQPYNDVRNRGDSALTRMASVFSAGLFLGSFALKQRTRLNIPLSAGMCVGTGVLARHPWRAFTLSEDWELYTQLTAQGETIELAADAHVYAQEASSLRQSAPQRTRWSAGRLAVLRRRGRELITSARTNWRQKLSVVAELSAPGPATHLAIVVALSIVVVAMRSPGAPTTVAWLLATLIRPALYAFIGLWADPEPAQTARAFLFLPLYACWRAVIAVTTMFPARERRWTRTARHRP